MKRLVIIGAGGHGREALDIVEAINTVEPTFDFLGFLDDGREPGDLASPHEERILGPVSLAHDLDAMYVAAVGSPAIRRSVVESLPSVPVASLIHPEATVGSHCQHEPGLIMAAGARVTHGVTLGAHVHINVNATVSHDCQIGDFTTITPGSHLSGGVTLGKEVWVGIGATINQMLTVGDGVVLGAGSAVLTDIASGATAVGVPAEPLRRSRT